MPDKTLIIDHLKFSYEGLFNASELYHLVQEFFYEKNWNWHERINEEIITPTGKQIRLILEPWKHISDFYQIKMKIKIILTDVKDVEVEHENQNLKLNGGLVKMTLDGYVINDRKKRWESHILYWFLMTVFEKYFFKRNLERAETWIKHDVDEFLYKIKSFLNTYKYIYQT